VGGFFVRIASDPGRQHPVAVLLGDQRAIHGVGLRIRVLIEHHRLRSSRIGSIKPLETNGGRVDEEHRELGHTEMATHPGGSHGRGLWGATPVA